MLADKEVLRIVNLLEFIPGTSHGEKIEVNYTLPVNFMLQSKNESPNR